MFELDDTRRDELVETWSRRLVANGLGPAAVFLLEAHKPLAGLSAQTLVAFGPLLTPLIPVNVGEWAAFLRDGDSVERLIRRIEQLIAEREQRDAALHRRRRAIIRRARRIRKLVKPQG